LKVVIFDGVEAVSIVVALGAGGSGLLVPVTAGAAAVLLLVVLLGKTFHEPIAGLFNNSLRFAVGVLLSAFGTIWAGDGIGAVWPGLDATLIGLSVGYFLVAIGCVQVVRRGGSAGRRGIPADGPASLPSTFPQRLSHLCGFWDFHIC
jgi:Ca2+/H+ antiporter, TMEM165/GDT1 family